MKGYRCTKTNKDVSFGNEYWWHYPNKPKKDVALFMGNIEGTKGFAVRERCTKIRRK